MLSGKTSEIGQKAKSELRQLTVMFCDLVDSTQLSTQLDPEDMRDLLLRYREICAGEVKASGGFVAKYLGDGIVSYFGYPQAFESDVGNCLRSAQSIMRELDRFNDQRMRARIGVATGDVVVGDLVAGHTTEHDIAIGPTPNLAARLVSLGQPGEIIASGETRKLAGDQFNYEKMADNDLKGFAEPTTAWRVTKAANFDMLSPAVRKRGHSVPLIGREKEMEKLASLWRQARAGQGQAVLITGEAGIGKSRLASDFCDELTRGDDAPGLVRLYCSDIGRNSPFRPIASDILTMSKLTGEMSEAEAVRQIGAYLKEATSASETEVSLLREFLSLNRVRRSVSVNEANMARILDLLERYLTRMSPNQPAILVIEDIHWSDSATLELLERLLLERLGTLPLLVILTARTEFLPNWPNARPISSIEVGPLSEAESARFLDHIEAAASLPEDIRRQVIEHSNANPLFLEEICKATSENLSRLVRNPVSRKRAGGSHPVSRVPISLASLLMARLDRLGAVKEVAQVASVVGQVFSANTLSRLCSKSARELDDALAQLISADLIIRREKTVEPNYVFKHALTRDAAYFSMLRKERVRLHARLAVTMENELADSPESQPELIARHYELGGLPEKAIENWRLAGDLARDRSANSDAIIHFTSAIELLDEMPKEKTRDETEIELRTKLALALTAVHGAGSEEVGYNYSRSRSLSAYKADSEKHFPIMIGVWSNSFMGGDLNDAHSVTEEIMQIADSKDDASYALEANRVRGMTLFYRGNFSGALTHIARTLDLYDPHHHQRHALRFGLDPLVCCKAYLSYAQLFLGYTKEAIATSEQSVAEAKRTGHPYSQAFALAFAALVRVNLEMPREAGRLAQETIDCAGKSDIQFFAKQQEVVKAWAHTLNDPSAIAEMASRADAFLTSHTSIGATRVMCMMADVSLRHGRPSDAQTMLTRALDKAKHKGETYYLAEIYRLQAELLWAKQECEGTGAICAHLERAIDTAEEQKAAIWIRRTMQSAHRLHGLIAGHETAFSASFPDLNNFTADEADLSKRVAYCRRLIDIMRGLTLT